MKLAYFSALLIAAGYYYFSIVFPENYPPSRAQKLYIILLPVSVSVLLFFPHFLTREVIVYPWGKSVILGSLEYLVFFVLFLGFFIGGIVRQRRKLKKATGVIHAQLFYILAGVIMAGSFGVIFNLFLPSIFFQNFQYIWLGPIFTSILVFTTTYAILEHHLFNVKIIVTELLVFALWAVLLFRTLLSEAANDQLINGGLLLTVIVIGVLLIHSVIKEVKTREEVERLAKDLQKANERLRELDQRKSEFVSLASHQLRSPLTAIKGYSSMLLEGSFGEISVKVKGAIVRVFLSSNRLALIVEDFLTISRIEQGKLKYNFASIDFKDLVRTVVEEMRPTVEKKGLAISFVFDEKALYQITADSGKIAQVVSNLIDNAFKYTSKGSITVGLEKDEQNHKIKFSVKDSGIGMSAEIKKKMFDKFTRADNARRVNVSGAGVGLFVVKQLVEAHHGKIGSESEGEGKGSTFYVELPAEE